MTKYDIRERAMDFAVRCAKLIQCIVRNQTSLEYSKQLIRSSASIGANIEEADGAISRKDFVNKMVIARREARESRYWLRLMALAGISTAANKTEFFDLAREAEEILLILSSIVNKARIK